MNMSKKKVLTDRYQLIRQIGGGGMAIVYLANDTLLDRQVAIKFLREEYIDDPEFTRQFQKEAKAVAKLSHQNIVNIYDFGEQEEQTYLIMEYVEGQTLKEIIREHGALPVEQVLDYGIQICQGLIQAHNQHIVHKDIKPHNIMIDKHGIVKVTDFGIAQAANNLTITRNKGIMGSAHYFSPEQAKGEIVDYATDIYSLGVVLYEMVTGKVPFTGENPVSVALKHIQNKPESITKYGKDIPQELERIIFKAMEKNPAYRFSNMKQMMEALIDLQASLNGRNELIIQVPKTKTSEETLTDHRRVTADYYDETRIHNEVIVEKEVKNKQNKSKKKVNIGNLVVLTLIFCGLFAGGFFLMSNLTANDEIVVPRIVGQTALEGQKILVREGLSLEIIDEVYDDDYEEDCIISQEPKEGSKVKAGRKISVIVSKGSAQIAVPELKGLSVKEAQVALENEGLVLGEKVAAESKEYPAGKVVYQSVAANNKVIPGTVVDIMVSEGSSISLPDFKGKPLEEAKEMIELEGLTVGTVSEESSMEYEAGKIISQSPIAGTTLDVGDKVNLVVSNGSPTDKLKTGEIALTISQTGQIMIEVNDEQGMAIVYNQHKKAGDHIQQQFTYAGSAQVTVYCDRAVILTKNYN